MERTIATLRAEEAATVTAETATAVMVTAILAEETATATTTECVKNG